MKMIGSDEDRRRQSKRRHELNLFVVSKEISFIATAYVSTLLWLPEGVLFEIVLSDELSYRRCFS